MRMWYRSNENILNLEEEKKREKFQFHTLILVYIEKETGLAALWTKVFFKFDNSVSTCRTRDIVAVIKAEDWG